LIICSWKKIVTYLNITV